MTTKTVEFRGDPGDLERFARDVLGRSIAVDELGRFERRLRWDAGDSAGSTSSTRLRSGLALSATTLRWERPWAFRFVQAATPLKFHLGRGASPRMTMPDGRGRVLESGMLQVTSAPQLVSSTCEFVAAGACEQLALEIQPTRLKELLGSPSLPRALSALLSSDVTAAHEQPMAPALSRLLEEILHCEARGACRQLYLEAKGLELLAVLIDELELASEAMSPLGRRDVERLERARRLLLEQMTCPPSLPEIARHVGLNEVKLKTGFRTLFGTSVFAYLRNQRMEAARRLLAQRDLSVTEVALQVGYENPSKFAAAFRKQFGVAPSDLR